MKSLLFKLIVPFVLGMGTIFTFFREVVIAYYYGTSRELEFFRIAFSVPYALFQSLGTVLIGALLPIIIHEGKVFMNEILNQIRKIFFFIFVFAIATSSWQAKLFAPGFNTNELDILQNNIIICWSILLFSALIFPIRLFLQSEDKKILVSSTSMLYSFFFILFIVIFNTQFAVYDLAIISVFSAFIVFIVYVTFGAFYRDRTLKTIEKSEVNKKIQTIILGSLVYVLFLSVPRLLDKAFASKMHPGVIANLEYAMNFYVAIGVLVGTSFTIIYAKKIALEYTNSHNIKWLLKIIGIPFLITTAIVSCLFPFSEELVRLAYFRGAFGESNVLEVNKVLSSFLVALPVMVAGMILLQIIAAYSILILIFIAVMKSVIKLLWMILFFDVSNLSIFGTSTIMMELVSIIMILIFLNILSVNSSIRKIFK